MDSVLVSRQKQVQANLQSLRRMTVVQSLRDKKIMLTMRRQIQARSKRGKPMVMPIKQTKQSHSLCKNCEISSTYELSIVDEL